MTSNFAPLTRRAALIGAAVPLLTGRLALAQSAMDSFPSKTIRLVVPFAPGTGADMAARMFSNALHELSGQPVVVENKPGANGIIAIQSVLRAPADGHTIFMGSNSTLSTNAVLLRNPPYDPVRDLAPIMVITRSPCAVIVPPQSPYKTLSALIEAARKQPGKLNYGSGSPSYNLYTVWMNELAGIAGNAISYKDASGVMSDIAGGQIDYAVVDSTAAQPLIKGGKLSALAIADDRRSATLPDVPTVKEAGLPEFQAFSWTAVAVSAQTPAPVVQRIEAMFAKAGQSKDVQDMLKRLALTPWLSSGAEMRKFQIEEIGRWKRLATKVNLQVE